MGRISLYFGGIEVCDRTYLPMQATILRLLEGGFDEFWSSFCARAFRVVSPFKISSTSPGRRLSQSPGAIEYPSQFIFEGTSLVQLESIPEMESKDIVSLV
jgi:hypothetical protein